MHELSLCQDMMDQVMAIAHQNRAEKVLRIIVRIGPLSGVEAQLLESAFTISRAGTLAEDAELVTETQAVRVYCGVCGTESEATVNNLLCRQCGDCDTRLVSGDELILARVELQSADDKLH